MRNDEVERIRAGGLEGDLKNELVRAIGMLRKAHPSWRDVSLYFFPSQTFPKLAHEFSSTDLPFGIAEFGRLARA
jgi:hypothetical protein